jgi:hypothetical protein
MTASNTLTFDQDPPHRPALSELGGATKENDPVFPPDPVIHPTAEEFNQLQKQAEAFGRVAPLARIWVTFSAGTPSIAAVQALGSAVVASSFTLVDNGAGDTTIWWRTGAGAPAGALPPTTGGGCVVSQTDDVEIDRIRAFLTTVSSNPAVRVKTKLGATGTDANFVVEVY